MRTIEPMTGLPQPPSERALPGQERRRRELLAVIAADRPLPRVSRWAVPLGAAAAVIAIAVTAAALVPAIGHRAESGGRPGPTAAPREQKPTPCSKPAGAQCQLTDSFTAAAPRDGLTVLDDVGSVTVTGSNRDSILVTETFSYRGYPPVATRSASGVMLTLGYRCRSGDCGDVYRIEVPRSLSVRVSSGTGLISLTSLAGQVHASANVGSIRGAGLSSAFAEFHTDVGSIEAAFTSPPGHLAASANTGSVVLLVPGGPGYDVTASSSVGSVSVRVRQDAASGRVIDAIANLGSVTVASG
jgi:hypothetical protein